MPAPVAVYVVVSVVAVGAAIAFKEFVYDPHIQPHVTRLAEEFQENRRRHRQQQRLSRPHGATTLHSSDSESDSDPLLNRSQGSILLSSQRQQGGDGAGNASLRRRRTQGQAESDEERYGPPYVPRTRGPASTSTGSTVRPAPTRKAPPPSEIELHDLAPEVRAWNQVVSRSRSALDETNDNIKFAPLQPSCSPSASSPSPSSNANSQPPPTPPKDQPTHYSLPTQSPFTLGTSAEDSPRSFTSTTASSTPTGTPHARRMQDLPSAPPAPEHSAVRSGYVEANAFPSAVAVEGPMSESILFSTSTDAAPSHSQAAEPASYTSGSDLSSLITSPALPQSAFPLSQPGAGVREPKSYSDLSSLATSPSLPQSAFPNTGVADKEGSTSASSSVFHTPRTDAGLGLTPVRSRSPVLPSTTSPPIASSTPPTLAAASHTSASIMSASSSQHTSQDLPSLSQLYHQDHLEYEHGLVLLSPPSSRSESPFSVVSSAAPSQAGSPRQRQGLAPQNWSTQHQGDGGLVADGVGQGQRHESADVTRSSSRLSEHSSTSDFDMLSPGTSAFNSPAMRGVSSPFESVSPFASPRVVMRSVGGGQSGRRRSEEEEDWEGVMSDLDMVSDNGEARR